MYVYIIYIYIYSMYMYIYIYIYVYIYMCVCVCVKLKYEIKHSVFFLPKILGLLLSRFCQNCINSANLVAKNQAEMLEWKILKTGQPCTCEYVTLHKSFHRDTKVCSGTKLLSSKLLAFFSTFHSLFWYVTYDHGTITQVYY